MILNNNRINWDFIGLSISFLCMLHCMILPILIFLFPLIGLSFINNIFYEILLITGSLTIGFIAIYKGYKKYHKKLTPSLLYFFTAFFFIMGFWIENHFFERTSHLLATILLIVTHYYNWKLVKIQKECTIKKIQ